MASSSNNRYIPPHRRLQHESSSINDLESQFCNAFDGMSCINLKQRPDKWRNFQRHAKQQVGVGFQQKVKRFNAMDGSKGMIESSEWTNDVALEWDSSQNALWDRHVKAGIKQLTPGEIGCALSHVALWRELVESSTTKPATMLILEDDVEFYSGKRQQRDSGSLSWRRNRRQLDESSNRFLEAFSKLWTALPEDWGIFYLGFSDRGERIPIDMKGTTKETKESTEAIETTPLEVKLFRPTYGFQTHAYAITSTAATTLLEHLPVVGPIDVWLADNQWFGLNVYCGVIANEGWKGTGAYLATQRKSYGSNVAQSGRNHNERGQ